MTTDACAYARGITPSPHLRGLSSRTATIAADAVDRVPEASRLERLPDAFVAGVHGYAPGMGDYCCRWMQADLERVCAQHADRFDCPDALVDRATDGRYGLIVHDGGSSSVTILVCPWCGSELHAGTVDASLYGSAESDGVQFDLSPALNVASDEVLVAAARAQWSDDATRPLLDLAAEMDASVAAELAELRQTEVSKQEDCDWQVVAMEADRWLRKHRPALAHAADELVEAPGRPGRRLDLGT